MAEYIDRAVCLSILRAKANMAVLMDSAPYFEKAAQMLEKLPDADVAPVVHGRDVYKWHKEGHCEFKCSVCGAWAGIIEGGTLDGVDFDYCPNCGAKMDGGADDADQR